MSAEILQEDSELRINTSLKQEWQCHYRQVPNYLVILFNHY